MIEHILTPGNARIQNKGTSLRVIQETLGHADLKTTTIYVGLAREEMDRQLQENAL